MNKQSNISKIVLFLIGLVVVNFIANTFHIRFDLTQDNRYTLSKPTVTILEDLDKKITIKVYLEGDFPAEFKRLQVETRQLLEEFKSENSNINFKFINPLDSSKELIKKGLEPSQLSIQQNGKISEIVIFPWATIQTGKRIEKVSLLKDTNAQSQTEQLQNAIQNLEYAFADAIHKVTSKKNKKIAVLKGNGELSDIYIADFLRKLGEYYHIAPFTLDSVASNPKETLNKLNNFDLAIIAKPTEKFTEKEKYTLDQFITNGGKTLWMLDKAQAELDSLMATGESLAYPRELKLTDLLFSYGIRINHDLVQDLYNAKIPLATGNIGGKTQYNPFPWHFYPVILSANNHPINKHIEPVVLKFTSSIDLLKNDIKKTVLLQSSHYSKTVGIPTIISLSSIRNLKRETFTKKSIPLAVLLEGEFKSAYSDRIKPFKINSINKKSSKNKMIVIADGDIIANQISRGKPEELGVDKWTGERFGNKEFLLNSVNYLLDDSGLINIRSKTIELKVLDREKAYKNRVFYQVLNIALPLILLTIFGIVFMFIRKRKYQ